MAASSCLTYEGYKAWIEIDGQELPCYSTDVDHANKIVTCWIASEAGKTFSIGCQPNNSKLSSRLRASAYLDGMLVKRCVLWDKEEAKCRRYLHSLSTSDTTEAPFVFSMLELTDDDNYLEAPSTANVGEVKLIFETITDPVWKNTKSQRYAQTLPTEKVHERSKKAMTHRINFGDERLKKKSYPLAHCTRKELLVTFIFRYRSLDVLQANGIVPRIQDLVMPSQANDLPTSSLSPRGKRKATYLKEEVWEDVKIFEDRENALLAELSRLKDKNQFLSVELERLRKDKHSTNDNAPRKKVKQESKPLLLSGEVIDLT